MSSNEFAAADATIFFISIEKSWAVADVSLGEPDSERINVKELIKYS